MQIGVQQFVYTSTTLAGTTSWTNTQLVSNPSNSAQAFSFGVDANGNAVLFWAELSSPTQAFIRAADMRLGGEVNGTTNLTDPNALNTYPIDFSSNLVVDAFGNAVATWGISSGGTLLIQAASKGVNQHWSSNTTFSTNGSTPRVVLSNQGKAVLVWIDGVSFFLMGSSNINLFPLQAPPIFLGKKVAVKFVSQTARALNMKWIPSLAPNIVSYEIRKNGKVVGTVPGSGPFKFRFPFPKKSSKFTLQAIASNGNRSTPIPLVVEKGGSSH